MKIYYNKNLKALSKKLRRESTLAEILLWQQLKGKKIRGLQFMRQKPIIKYVVDFYCSKLRLIIEIDGASHIDLQKDRKREEELISSGFNMIRFSDSNIKQDIDGALEAITKWIDDHINLQQPPVPVSSGISSATRFIKGELIRFWEMGET